MSRARQLTIAERWELGLFLSMLVVGCLCLTAILNVGGFPRMFAVAGEKEVKIHKPVVSRPQPVTALTDYFVGDGLLPVTPVISVDPLPTISLEPAITKKPAVLARDIKWYKGEKYRFAKTLRLRVTAYAPDGRCCWPYPGTTTATGLSVKTNHGHLVAADPRLIPMHALVAVPGYEGGAAVPVLDQGGAIKGYRLDVMLPSFDAAKEWGSRMVDVKVYELE